MSKYPLALQQLIASLKMLPGVGSKTAERFAFQLLTWQDEMLADFAGTVATLKTKIHTCPACNCLMDTAAAHQGEVDSFEARPRSRQVCEESIVEALWTTNKIDESAGRSSKESPQLDGQLLKEVCEFCDINKRDSSLLCIISSPKDAYAIEETHTYKGLYHVLGGLLSPLDGRTTERLGLPQLIERISRLQIREVIVALDSTLEGDATALYLKEQIDKLNIPVSRLALGLPMGSPLEYVDGGTLSRALTGRRVF